MVLPTHGFDIRNTGPLLRNPEFIFFTVSKQHELFLERKNPRLSTGTLETVMTIVCCNNDEPFDTYESLLRFMKNTNEYSSQRFFNMQNRSMISPKTKMVSDAE